MEYPKTENLYAQSPDRRSRGPEFGFKAPGVTQISKWLVTEKIDGMNMRVVFQPDFESDVLILGRTDRAQIPGDLMDYMKSVFTKESLESTFRHGLLDLPDKVVLFGEGFGPGIQKAGQAYGGTKRFGMGIAALREECK